LALEFGIDGQGKSFLGGTLRFAEISGLVPKWGVDRLQMQRHWIVDRAADFALGEELLKRVPASHANRVLVKDVFAACGNGWGCHARDTGQQLGIFGRARLASFLPFRDVPQLDAENGRLDFIEAAIETGFAADVLPGLAVIAKGAQPRSDRFGVGDRETRI